MLDITKKNASVKLTKPFMKGEDGGYYWPEWNDEGQLIWQASEDGMPIIPPFDVKGEDGGYYTPITDDNGELNWVPSNENMPAITGVSLATKEYVDEAVKDVEVDVDLDEYALKTDIPDTTGFITMPEVENKGYQTEEEVRAIVAEGGDVFIGAGMPSVSAEVVEGSVGYTAVSITNESSLINQLTKGSGIYYVGCATGGAFDGYLYYGYPGEADTIKVATVPHMGSFASSYGLNISGSYSGGWNFIKIVYSTGDAGKEGLVPAPEAGSVDKLWLNSSGVWMEKSPFSGTALNAEIFNDKRNLADKPYSHAEGIKTEATKEGAHAEGIGARAGGFGAHAEGCNNNYNSGGYTSSSVSSGPYAGGKGSHAEGVGYSYAYGDGSHVEGHHYTSGRATSNGAHLEGYSNEYVNSYGYGAHVEGYNSTTDTNNANGIHIEGGYNYGRTPYQHVQGKYAVKDVDDTYADIVGNGTGTNDTGRANAYTLDWSGNATFAGTITSATGADYAEYFEWLDGNPEEEDRVGYIVKLNGNKIEFANADDDILGIISGTMTVLGDNAEWYWQGKYLTDDFGRIIYEDKAEKAIEINPETGEEEEVVVAIFPAPKLNPNYDADMPYENRKVRPEWDAVGMMGKLYVRDDGTAQVNGYVTANNGIATASGTRTNMRVMERVSENIIRVCLK